ncbi:MAG: hypothetical protein NTU49_02895 [Gammaproteobacteria bacterium]|nr:hypothetical protein [Gammaproteobacteria bacterium]
MSALATVVFVLIVIGILLWLINTYIPMAKPIKTILNVVVVLCVIFWLLSVFGIVDIGSVNHISDLKVK